MMTKKTAAATLSALVLAGIATVNLSASAGASENATASTADDSPRAVIDDANRLMNLAWDQFANEPKNPPFDWSTDGCSGPGPAYWNDYFAGPCLQHDFGYRNYGAHGALKLSVTRETKNWIDDRFGVEMLRACEQHPLVADCNNMAMVYLKAVREGGDPSFF